MLGTLSHWKHLLTERNPPPLQNNYICMHWISTGFFDFYCVDLSNFRYYHLYLLWKKGLPLDKLQSIMGTPALVASTKVTVNHNGVNNTSVNTPGWGINSKFMHGYTLQLQKLTECFTCFNTVIKAVLTVGLEMSSVVLADKEGICGGVVKNDELLCCPCFS